MGTYLILPTGGKGQIKSPEQAQSLPTIPTQGLVLPPVGRFGRNAIPVDAVAAAVVAGKWTPPQAGDTVPLPDGTTRRWETVQAKDNAFNHAALNGGYAYLAVPADAQQVMVLEAAGHTMVYVNGEPRTGDIYQYGYVHLPILLHKGMNDLLFHCARGTTLRAKLTPPKAAAQLDTSDLTLPDLPLGEAVDTEAAVVVLNTTAEPMDGLAIAAALDGGKPVQTPVPSLLPLGTRKVGFRLQGPAPKEGDKGAVELTLLRRTGEQWQTLDTAKFNLGIVKPEQTHKRTFRSGIDGSVQYYAVVPLARQPRTTDNEPPAQPGLILTLHGAGVEAIGQAACYSPKSWAHVVAPTNRRPFGFDWEDWGRLDALEVLELNQQRLETDPRRTWLTGHSMGGHGTWILGATYPDRFAAIGPSAGWISMWSYAGAQRTQQPTPLQDLLLRASSPSDTLALLHNYAHDGIYLLHGDKDDNVPVGQAREMLKHLCEFHQDFAYHEQVGAGHWWGNACVDWPPLIDFLRLHTIPERSAVHQVDFVTASPGVSAWSHWAAIEAQVRPLKPSSVSIQCDPEARRFHGTTDNVARLALDVGHLPPDKPLSVELDGQKMDNLPWPDEAPRLWLQRTEEKWAPTAKPSPDLKGQARYGPFKEAFRNRMVFVYGTQGTPEENAWALAKARFDAETFWYRGNGSVEVVADTAFNASADHDRNVILYGHADSNAVWKSLLEASPVQVRRGSLSIGGREEKGEDVACLFVRPRPGSERALVGVVAGTGLTGMRVTDRLPYFLSGVGYPDCLVLRAESLTRGNDGLRAAGYFGPDWGVQSGEFAWKP
jgi:pimeloyl-ACP methyl ester carboxylesterase